MSNRKAAQECLQRLIPRRCYHHKRNETTESWTGSWHGIARRRQDGRRAAGGGDTTRPWGASPISGPAASPASGSIVCGDGRPGPDSYPGHPGDRTGQRWYRPWRRRLFAPLPARRRNSVARSHRGLLSFARNRIYAESLAHEGQLGARTRSPHVPDHGPGCCGLSLPRRELVLAGAAQVGCYCARLR